MAQAHVEMKSEPLSKDELSSLDRISTIPEIILESILWLLPTKDAARTSVLSKEWRYKWTTIPKLDFYLSDFSKVINEEKQAEGKSMDRIHQVLLSHQGPIHEFALDIDQWEGCHDNVGLDRIIRHLSKNHIIQKLTLCGRDFTDCYELPISVFSMHHLTDLDLSHVDLERQPILHGFYGLKSLVLYQVGISNYNLVELLSDCPSLKSLTLFTYLESAHDTNCPILELFKCVPMIENLTIHMDILKWVVLNTVPEVLPTLLPHLRYFCFEDMCFRDGFGLGFLLILIKCSPNMEKIKLEINGDHHCFWNFPIVWDNYSDVWLEHLNELEIAQFSNTGPEMEFMNLILARSPKLKNVKIQSVVDGEEKLQMVEALSRAPRAPSASPVIIYV